MPHGRDAESEAKRRRVEGEMIPTGSPGEPLAQEGEREVRRKLRRVDGESVEPSHIETTGAPEDESHKPPTQTHGWESVEGSPIETTDDARTDPVEEPVSPMESPSSSARTGPEEESASPKECPSSDVKYVLTEEMRQRFRSIMSRYAANRPNNAAKDRRESVDRCNLTVETEFGDVDDGSFQSCKARKVAVLASKSVVSLSSFSDKKRIRVCSGFIIESDPCTNINKILTSATLVRCLSTRNRLIPDLKIKVCQPNGQILDGSVAKIDFHFNIAIVEVNCDQKLPEAVLVSDVIKKGDVLAIGRFYDNGAVMCAQGEIRKEASLFECSELLVSSCRTTMAGVGGPLVNYSGHVVGINFYGENHTPFLSTAIIIRCLDHWKSYGKIIRPWLGLIYTHVDTLPIRVLEKCTYVHKGFYISKVANGSPAYVAGLCTGDVLIECAGKVPNTAPELGALLLDFCKEQMESCTLESNMTVEVVVRKQSDGKKARKRVIANVLSECSYYSWYDPLPSYTNNKVATIHYS